MDATTSIPAAIVLAGGATVDAADVGPVPPHAWTVAADSGLALAEPLGVTVSLVVGDMDSVDPHLLHAAAVSGVPIERHPADKDATDLELALEAVVRRGHRAVLILGGGGGRLDHLLASALLLTAERFASLTIEWRPGPQRIHVADAARPVTVAGSSGDVVSLIPAQGRVIGVTTTGLEWSLEGETLEAGTSRGVSNRLATDTASVHVEAGVLLIVHERGIT